MRLLIIVLSILLLAGFLGFVMMNLDSRAEVTIWETTYPNVSLHLVVVLSLFAGILYSGIIGIAQGVQMWVANRRLGRDVQKLETELNYHRTQPSARPRSEPDVAEVSEETSLPGEEGLALPSAPVYRAEDNDEDPDDDVYSGGRAV